MRADAPHPPLIHRLQRVDTVAGLVLIAICAVLWHQILPLDVGQLSYFGPGFLPRLLVSVLSVLAVALTWLGLSARGDAETLVLKLRGPLFVALAVLFFAATIRGLAVAGLAIAQLGLFVAAPVTVIIAGFGSREADWRELIALGLGLTALVSLVFSDLLSMTIPVFPAAVETLLPHNWRIWPQRAVCLLYALAAIAITIAIRRQRAKAAR